MSRFPPSPFIYPLTDRSLTGGRPIGEIVAGLCSAGAKMIQLREKGQTTRRLRELALEAVEAAHAAGAALIINDRPDVAIYSAADGVHLGDDDLPPEAARDLLGPGAVIGVSCHSLDDVRRASGQPADYLAVGPVFPTQTKELRYGVVGVELLRRAREITSLPLVAIGGIGLSNAAEVVAAGADGLAFISAVMVPGEVESRTRELIAAVSRLSRRQDADEPI